MDGTEGIQVKTEPIDNLSAVNSVAEEDGERSIKDWKPDVDVTFKGRSFPK